MNGTPILHAAEVLISSQGDGWNQEMARTRVPGGWLYFVQVNSIRGVAVALQFVPDPPIQEPR